MISPRVMTAVDPDSMVASAVGQSAVLLTRLRRQIQEAIRVAPARIRSAGSRIENRSSIQADYLLERSECHRESGAGPGFLTHRSTEVAPPLSLRFFAGIGWGICNAIQGIDERLAPPPIDTLHMRTSFETYDALAQDGRTCEEVVEIIRKMAHQALGFTPRSYFPPDG